MAIPLYIVDSCYRHGMTEFQEQVAILYCDAAGKPTSTDSWYECVECGREEDLLWADEEL